MTNFNINNNDDGDIFRFSQSTSTNPNLDWTGGSSNYTWTNSYPEYQTDPKLIELMEGMLELIKLIMREKKRNGRKRNQKN